MGSAISYLCVQEHLQVGPVQERADERLSGAQPGAVPRRHLSAIEALAETAVADIDVGGVA